MLQTLLIAIPRTLLAWLFLAAAVDGFSYIFRGKDLFEPPLSAAGKEFLHNLKRYSVLWTVKATIDLIAALMLILNFHAPLGLLLILPSIVVIIVFQLSINKTGPIAVMLTVLTLVMVGHYFTLYTPLLGIEDGRGPLASGPYGHPAGPSP
jgi:hypothetical protein